MKSVTVKFLPNGKFFVIDSSNPRVVKGEEIEIGKLRLATKRGYRIIILADAE